MTPLAHRIVKELTLPVKDRTFVDRCGLMGRMDDVHCFDCSSVLELADELDDQLVQGLSGRLAFLPAERTWLEWVDAYGDRYGALLEQHGDKAVVRGAYTGIVGREAFSSLNGSYTLPLHGDMSLVDMRKARLDCAKAGPNLVWPPLLYALLAIINTPRLIGRKQHMPHRGLERRLAKAKGLVGEFPLHAWTELTLSVSAMMKEDDGTTHEAHLTGEKCLHFCRSHIRVKQGRLELVKAHWRGNPALGIKRTRYKLAA